MVRRNIGARRWMASFYEHNGNTQKLGLPDYTNMENWVVSVAQWPCEMIAASGGEVIRGRQVTATSTHVLFGEYFGGEGVTPEMKVLIEGKWYGIVSVLDKDGTTMEQRIEVKQET